MKTLLINCSPKLNQKESNSRILCEEFVRDMKYPCEIKSLVGSKFEELSLYIQEFDTVIFVLPLYIHGMPEIMMEFIEHLQPSKVDGESLGFIIQSGFPESHQHDYLEKYFKSLTKKLNCNYLGSITKGGCAAIYMFPKMFKKLLKKFNELGKIFEETNAFDNHLKQDLAKPYNFSWLEVHFLQFTCDTGLNNIGWNKMLKQNNAYEKRLDKPFFF